MKRILILLLIALLMTSTACAAGFSGLQSAASDELPDPGDVLGTKGMRYQRSR